MTRESLIRRNPKCRNEDLPPSPQFGGNPLFRPPDHLPPHMSKKPLCSRVIVILLTVCAVAFALPADVAQPQPNILFIHSEDINPHLGCYGDTFVKTPNLDAFAARSLRYTEASSNGPICAPAKTTLFSGVYPPSFGAHHMRSAAEAPEWFVPLSVHMRKAGYTCAKKVDSDFNIINVDSSAWYDDAKNRIRTYSDCPPGKSCLAFDGFGQTNERFIWGKSENPVHDPAKVPIPPYHPDSEETRNEWAHYYDRIAEMDVWFGEQLAELEAKGLAENTIVIFTSDHGSGMPRSKRYSGWSGVHVPFIMHIPEKFKALRPTEYTVGGVSDRLISFVDIAPTFLSFAGVKKADFHQGRAFAGKFEEPSQDYSVGFVGRTDERPDESRSITDGRYLYVRNFKSNTPLLKGVQYQMIMRTSARWRELFEAGELNDI